MRLLISIIISSYFVTVYSVKEIELECEKIPKTWRSPYKTEHSCEFHQVHVKNNFTKIRILDSEFIEFPEVLFQNSTFFVFPVELIEQLPEVTTILMTSVQLKIIPESTFASAQHLETLDLSKNNLTEIGEKTFCGAENLESLTLHGNKIKIISKKAFLCTPKVRFLVLSFNELELIEAETFAPLTNLKYLDMNNNKLKEIASNAFVNNPLKYGLILSDNKLNNLELNIGTEVRDIKVSNNKLKSFSLKSSNSAASVIEIVANNNELSSMTIDSTIDVKQIRLDNNKMENLDSLLSLSSLIVLSLSNNSLKHIQGLDKFPNLKRLDLSQNKVSLDQGVFNPLKNLKWIKLSNTAMTKFDFEWFGTPENSLENLQTLEINQNKLTEFDFTEVHRYFPGLRGIMVNDNPFNCSFVEQMLKYFELQTKIQVWDADTESPETNVEHVKCQTETKEDPHPHRTLIWGLVFGMAALGIVIGFAVYKYKRSKAVDPVSFSYRPSSNMRNSEIMDP
ncbi:protein artichoke-like [Culicoides brevitarsis]|uniref:protein artichoke-like n=1 Tax=Culicoides brevitarsis TaxID=469753 RepID=UPI00307C2A2E